MRSPFSRSTALVVLTLFATLVSSQAAFAGRKVTANGQLVSLSAANRTVTVAVEQGNRQLILRTNERTTIVRNGVPVHFAGLALRDRVSAQYDVASSMLVRLEARGVAVASTRGTFASWDLTTRTLRVASPNGEKSFLVAPTTLVLRNGRAASPGDFSTRDALLVHTRTSSSATPTAMDVSADGPESDEVEGSITAIAANDVTITPRNGAAVTVHVDDATEIELHDHGTETDGTLADLEVGQRAEAHYLPSSLVALKIEAQASAGTPRADEVHGQITAVDASAGSVTIEPRNGGAAVTVTTDSNTRISLNDAPARLGDLPVGARAEAHYNPTTLVASRIEAEDDPEPQENREAEGRVSAITSTSITIDREHGDDVTVTTDASTRIRVNGQTATLADIPVGARVHAHYDAATSIASRIDAQVRPDSGGELAEAEGRLTAASATEITIAREHGTPVTLTIDAATVITRNGRPAAAADLRVGDEAEARYVRGTSLAKSVRAHEEDDEEDD